MKKLFAIALLILGISLSARAQGSKLKVTLTNSHSASLTWTESTTGTTFNVYRAPCTAFTAGANTPNVGTCSTAGTGIFANICGSSCPGIGVFNYADTSVVGATSYVYQVTSICGTGCPAPYTNAGESLPSNAIAVLVPSSPTPPPSLTIGTIAVAKAGTCCVTINTSWLDQNLYSTYLLFNQNGILSSRHMTSSSGTYNLSWKGLPFQIVTATLAVCDLDGCVWAPIPPLT